MSTNVLGEKIKSARIDAHLSQKELSEALVVSEKAVSSYESGRSAPSINTLEKIAEKTKKPITYFTNKSNNEITIISKLMDVEAQLKEIKKLLAPSNNP